MSKSYLYIGAVTGAYLLGLGLGIKLAKGYYAEKADREITETRLYLNDWYNEMPDPKSFHEEMSRQYGMSVDDAVNDILNNHHEEMSRQYGMSIDDAVNDILNDHQDSTAANPVSMAARDETTDDIIEKLEEASVEDGGEISEWDYSHDYYDYTKTSIDLFPKVNIIKEDGIIIPESDWSTWFPVEFIRGYRQSNKTEAVYYRNHALETDFEILKNFDRVG